MVKFSVLGDTFFVKLYTYTKSWFVRLCKLLRDILVSTGGIMQAFPYIYDDMFHSTHQNELYVNLFIKMVYSYLI